ncbi:MAG TPA: hypothetical protein VGH28_16535 [Polyangiaceae bacterium]
MLFALAASVATVACIEPQPVTPANGSSALVAPGQSPPPTTPDARLPASLPPPPAASDLAQSNPTYRTGSRLSILGGALLGAGIALVVVGALIPCKLGDANCPTQGDVDSQNVLVTTFLGVGVGSLIVGGVLLAIGIPVSVIGANQVRHQLGYAFFADSHGLGLHF